MNRFSRIAELSDLRRLPRVGKIHLGVKERSAKTGNEYPREVDYFVFDPEEPFYARVKELYGEAPKALRVVLPSEETADFFPQALKYYGAAKGLVCTGDGRDAKRVAGVPVGADLKALKLDGARPEMEEIACAYEECPDHVAGRCKRMGNLFVLLPEVTMAGVWQVDTSSFHSIVDLNSSIEYVRGVVGRVGMLFDRRTLKPFLTLRRMAKETHGSGRKEIHWPMTFELNADLGTILGARALPEAPRVALPEAGREDDLIPASVRRTLPPEPEQPPVAETPRANGSPVKPPTAPGPEAVQKPPQPEPRETHLGPAAPASSSTRPPQPANGRRSASLF